MSDSVRARHFSTNTRFTRVGLAWLTIDVAETTGFALLGVMQATSPIDRDVALLAIESSSTLHRASSADTAELKEAVENGAIVADVVSSLLAHVGVHVIRCDLREEVDILVRMELGHLGENSWFRALLAQVSNVPCEEA